MCDHNVYWRWRVASTLTGSRFEGCFYLEKVLATVCTSIEDDGPEGGGVNLSVEHSSRAAAAALIPRTRSRRDPPAGERDILMASRPVSSTAVSRWNDSKQQPGNTGMDGEFRFSGTSLSSR